MLPENMPGYRGPRSNPSDAGTEAPTALSLTAITELGQGCVDPSMAPILLAIYLNESGGSTHCLQNVPVRFGFYSSPSTAAHYGFYNDHLPALASKILSFSSVVYGFNSGHFAATCAF